MEPLYSASREGNIDGLYAAIQDNPQILSIIDEIPFVGTPLHVAVSSGHVQFALEIMRLQPSFATKCNPDGFTPIHIAIQNKYTQMVACFVDTDPGLVRAKGREGMTPLHLVAKKGDLVLLRRFIEACPESIQDVNVRYETALHIALNNSMFEAFQLLLDRLQRETDEKANNWKKRVVNRRDLEGNTLLHISTFRNQVQVIESLATYNKSNPGTMEVNAKNERNQTAMDIAGLFNHFHIQQLLGQMVAERDAQPNNINPIPENDQQISENEVNHQDTNIPSREEIYKWEDYFKFDLGKSSPETARSDLLVVAVLMATATYQAVLNPPGGIDDKTGIALLGNLDGSAYVSFMFFNGAGFLISLNMIVVLMHEYPLYWELYVAIFSMASTYSSAMGAITPPGIMRGLLYAVLVIMAISLPILTFRIRKCLKRRRHRRNRHVNATVNT
ncbi:Ankyrin repeat family protein [Euphorbia peplus]|nr:Ankyrin repeat family protein [Euphorbia peplus]